MVGISGPQMSVRHADVWAVCHTYSDRPPILVVTVGGLNISVTVDQDAEDSPVDVLVRAVEEYAAALTEWRQHRAECSCLRPAVTP